RVTRVRHLDAIETERDHRLDPLARAISARMRPDGDAARLVDEPGRVGDLEARLLDIRGSLGAEPAIECITQIATPAAGHEGTGDMRPANGAVARFNQYGRHRDRHATLVERRHDSLRAGHAVGLEASQRGCDP